MLPVFLLHFLLSSMVFKCSVQHPLSAFCHNQKRKPIGDGLTTQAVRECFRSELSKIKCASELKSKQSPHPRHKKTVLTAGSRAAVWYFGSTSISLINPNVIYSTLYGKREILIRTQRYNKSFSPPGCSFKYVNKQF